MNVFPAQEIETLREETPGCQHVLHLNHAGASLQPRQVIEAVRAYHKFEYIQGGYAADRYFMEDFEQVKEWLGKLIHAPASTISLQQSATDAWNAAFWSLEWNSGDIILTGEHEYGSNYLGLLSAKKRFGVEIVVIPSDQTGQIDLTRLEQAIRPNVKLIALTHMPTNGGLINPAERVGELAQKYNIPYLLDACQSAGQYPLDVNKLQCDFLSATGRKYLRGPRGTGFLYVNPSIVDQLTPLSPDLRSAIWQSEDTFRYTSGASRFDHFENHRAGLLGLGAAAKLAHELGIERIYKRIQSLSIILREALSTIPHIELTDIGQTKGGICTFYHKYLSAEDVYVAVSARKINISISRTGSTLIDMKKRGLSELIRASVHYLNTEEELIKFVDIISHIGRK